MRGEPAHGLIGELLNPNDRIFSTMAVTVACPPSFGTTDISRYSVVPRQCH